MAPLLVWFFYINLVALLLSLAGWLAERLLLSFGRGARIAWAASMLLTALVPVGALAVGEQFLTLGAISAVDQAIAEGLVAVSGQAVTYTPGGEYRLATDYHLWIAGFWVACTGLTLTWLSWSARRLRRASDDWLPSDGGEEDCYITPSLGPGVTGVVRQRILLPQWVMGLSAEEQEMILSHEREHIRAGDNPLLAAGFGLVVLFPWILPLWWQFRRMRVAVELDCDRRVVRQCGDPRRYGELLIRVAQGSTLLPVAPFSTRSSPLRRRIRNLFPDRGRRRHLTMTAAGLAMCAVVVITLALPVPTARANWKLLRLDVPVVRETISPDLSEYEEKPELLNPEEVSRAIERAYPEGLRERGVEGEVGLLVHITDRGTVDQVRLQDPSPHEEFNRAATGAAGIGQYRPAREQGRPVDIWAYVTVQFRIPD